MAMEQIPTKRIKEVILIMHMDKMNKMIGEVNNANHSKALPTLTLHLKYSHLLPPLNQEEETSVIAGVD